MALRATAPGLPGVARDRPRSSNTRLSKHGSRGQGAASPQGSSSRAPSSKSRQSTRSSRSSAKHISVPSGMITVDMLRHKLRHEAFLRSSSLPSPTSASHARLGSAKDRASLGSPASQKAPKVAGLRSRPLGAKSVWSLESPSQKVASSQKANESSSLQVLDRQASPVDEAGSKTIMELHKLPVPDKQHIGPVCPSVKDGLERYSGSAFSKDELVRMRLCFQRFATESGNAAKRENLHAILVHLTYLTIPRDVAESIAERTSKFSDLDFGDFCEFCEQCASIERDKIQRKLRTPASKSPLKPAEELQLMMHNFGVVCTREAVHEMMELAGLSDSTCQTTQERLRFLAAYRARQGFTLGQLKAIQAAFEDCESNGPQKRGPEGRLVKPESLSNGLLDWAGSYVFEDLQALMDSVVGCLDNGLSPGVSFLEFVAFARQLQEAHLQKVFQEYRKRDTDQDGLIDIEDLQSLLQPVGFNILEDELAELLQKQNIANQQTFSFDDFWNFVLAMRDCHGFTAKEQRELIEAFNGFCDESGEMQNRQVKELLEFLGFENSPIQVAAMVKQVDYNGNGTMDIGEFLRLMRLTRENSMADFRVAYETQKLNETPTLRAIATALKMSNVATDQNVLENQIWPTCKNSKIDFSMFVRIAETCRQLAPGEKRKRARFMPDELALLRKGFAGIDQASDHASIGDLLRELAACGLPVNTPDGRTLILKQLDEAQKSARTAGVDESEIGRPRTPRVRFMTVVHLVRLILNEYSHAFIEKQDAALNATRFSAKELDKIRELFDSMVDAPASDKMALRSLALVIQHLAYIPHVKIERFMAMTMNVKTNLTQKTELGNRTMALADPDGRGLDFPSFVHMVQWMIDSDYGGISFR